MERKFRLTFIGSILLAILPVVIYFGGNGVLQHFQAQWRPFVFTGLLVVFSLGLLTLLVSGIVKLVYVYSEAGRGGKIGSALAIAGLMFLTGTAFLYFITVFAFTLKPEHIVFRQDKKCVACVEAFLDINVRCYEYRSMLTIGENCISYEWYGSGATDPFVSGLASYESDILHYNYITDQENK